MKNGAPFFQDEVNLCHCCCVEQLKDPIYHHRHLLILPTAHISPPTLYRNILSLILPPVFLQIQFKFYHVKELDSRSMSNTEWTKERGRGGTERSAKNDQLLLFSQLRTYRNSKNSRKHSKYKRIAHGISTPWPCTHIQPRVDGSVRGHAAILVGGPVCWRL